MEYEVKKGDGWYRIAKNLGVNVNDLLQANNAKLDTMLQPGQKLKTSKVPEQPSMTNQWQVVAGQNNAVANWAKQRVNATVNNVNQALAEQEASENEIQRKASIGTKGVVQQQAKADTIRLQQALLKEGYDLGRWGADGNWGRATDAAIAQAEKDGWTVDDHRLVKKPKQQSVKTESTPQIFGAAGPEYAVMAQAQMFKKDPSKDTLGNGIKSSIPYRMLYQASQAIKDGYNNVSEELAQGNYGKAAFSTLGTTLDLATIPGTAIGLKVAPSYAMPFKDIPITSFNRLGRYIFGDENYTAIDGRHYSNNDYSEGVNRVAKELMQSGKDVVKPMIDKKVKEEVDPNLDYGSPQLLKHPFNPTAAYAWTIGQQSVKTNEDGSVESVGDVFDNAKNKTNHYLNTGKQDLFRRMRGIGGLFTAHNEDPDEGKQTTTFRY